MGIERKVVIDVNVLSIFLVKDHPANSYVSEVMEQGIRGAFIPLVLDYLPIRAYWVMTSKWGCDKKESAQAVLGFIKAYDKPQYFYLKRESIRRSFELAQELRHDLYDCTYLAAALQERANAILTTDTDFKRLCGRVKLEYVNPVPKSVLNKFGAWNKHRRTL